jgi:hypothetical protein
VARRDATRPEEAESGVLGESDMGARKRGARLPAGEIQLSPVQLPPRGADLREDMVLQSK